MKRFYVILFAVILSGIFSCEEDVNSFDIPFKEKLVLRCVIDNDSPLFTIDVSRTQPLEGNFDDDNFFVFDADVTVKYSGIERHVNMNQDYEYASENIDITPGQKYDVIVKWKDKTAYASTRVPKLVNIDTAYIKIKKLAEPVYGYYWMREVKVRFRPNDDAVYFPGFSIIRPGYYSDERYSEGLIDIKERKPDPDGYLTETVTTTLSWDSLSLADKRQWPTHVHIKAFDSQYKSYYLSKGNSDEGFSSIFGLSGDNVTWNVKGDGIGMVVGMTTVDYKL